MRINMVLLSEAWIERFGNLKVLRGSRITSEHWPIILNNGMLKWVLFLSGLKACGLTTHPSKQIYQCGEMNGSKEDGKVINLWKS